LREQSLDSPDLRIIAAVSVTLTPGTRLGAYEVVSLLGAGGMGEVYRARDTKLNRDIALKILPEVFTLDGDRTARFVREAQVLASLNHPNIGHIYGLEDSGSTHALVLELVEGPTLADRIAKGAMPLDEALRVAKQIAVALEAAHEQGIIHRDLKPANIKIRNDGTVKVLDFGLAKALEPASATISPAVSASPTITTPAQMTGVGMILGTAAYMSPEQAKGRPADKRSDIWAFGCVLYEMLTGTRAFAAEDVSETLAAVLRAEPDWTVLPKNTPVSIRRLLRRALERDRRSRLADIVDAQLDIDDGAREPSEIARASRSFSPRREAAWATVTLAAVLVSVALGWRLFFAPPIPAPAVRFTVTPPTETPFILPAVSPDGQRIAFVAENSEGVPIVFVRAVNAIAPVALKGTERTSISIFWSADSRWVAFFADGKLKKIQVDGGTPVTICDRRGSAIGGTWNANGTILIGRSPGIERVSAEGGEPTPVTTPGASEAAHLSPFFLPDGRHFLYVVVEKVAPEVVPTRRVFVGDLDSNDRRPVLTLGVGDNVVNVAYAAGFLFRMRAGALVAHPFDVARLTPPGEAIPVENAVQTQYALAAFSVSTNGVLAYQPADAAAGDFRLTWLDRAGRQLSVLGEPGSYSNTELSPDGKRLAVSIVDEASRSRDIWTFDLTRGVRTRFTSNPADERAPLWSPDGSHITFNIGHTPSFDLFQKAANGAGSVEPLLQDGLSKDPNSWSPDGRFLVYRVTGPSATNDLWVLPTFGDRKPYPLVVTPFNENDASFSPNGRWVAYDSDESGRPEVYVTAFSGGGKWEVSTSGGGLPRWRGDGAELYYITPDGAVMAVPVKGDTTSLEIGTAERLFQAHPPMQPGRFYVVTADGQRFLFITNPAAPPPLTVVVNWTEEFKQRATVK
jgi:Tol biopolymer transport system component